MFTFYFGIASQSDVVEPGDDNDMPLLCLLMSARAKLRCRRRLSSFLSKPFICFGTYLHYIIIIIIIGHCAGKTIKYTQGISGKPSFSLALVANERVNDGHALRVPTNMESSWCGKPHMYALRCIFSITTQLAKGFKHNSPK